MTSVKFSYFVNTDGGLVEKTNKFVLFYARLALPFDNVGGGLVEKSK